jgi:hypothetical protein
MNTLQSKIDTRDRELFSPAPGAPGPTPENIFFLGFAAGLAVAVITVCLVTYFTR